MATSYGPKFVTNGLTFLLDAALIKSYPRTGATWYDALYRGWPTELRGSVYFSGEYGGGIDYPNGSVTNFAYLPVNVLNSLPSMDWTMSFWLKTTQANSSTAHAFSIATPTQTNGFIFRLSPSYVVDLYSTPIEAPKPVVSGSYPSTFAGEIAQYTLCNSTANCRFYKNDELKTVTQPFSGVNTAVGWVLNQDQDAISGGFDATQSYIGTFYTVSLYGRPLTSAEVLQNFNALRGRFGL